MVAQRELAGEMNKLLAPKRARWAVHQKIPLLAALLIVAFSGHASDAKGRCRRVTGNLVSQMFVGPECHSPVQLCTSGRFFGDIHASFVFTATSMAASADTPATGVSLYTGDMVIETAQGNVFLKEAGAFNSAADGTGDVGAVSVIVGGSAVHEGAAGELHLAGTFTAEAGGHSTYAGQICD
jgi:hypothetical protein